MIRHTVNSITSDALDALYDRIQTLEHVAAGNKRHVQLIVPDLEQAEAALARVRALHQREYDGTCSHCTGLYAVPYPCPTIQALDQPTPAATEATAWTPPPPGSTAEQLPDDLLDLIRDQMPDYTSTACQTADTVACAACYPGSGVPRPQYDEIREHAERLHERCRLNQKFTGALCACPCHTS